MKVNRMSAVALGVALALGAACNVDEQKVTSKPKVTKSTVVAQPQTPPPVEVPAPEPPPVVEPEPALSFDEHMAEGRELARKGQIVEAIDNYLAAAKVEPEKPGPRIALADLFIRQREPKLAREHAELAVKLAPKLSRAWNTLGRVELAEGKLPAAENAFVEATQRNESNIYAWNNLGLVRIKRHNYAEAVEALERATAGEKPEAYMLNNLGIALERLGVVDEALAAYKRGLGLGSGVAGQNFVRLERELELEETAEHIPTVEPTIPPTPAPPSGS